MRARAALLKRIVNGQRSFERAASVRPFVPFAHAVKFDGRWHSGYIPSVCCVYELFFFCWCWFSDCCSTLFVSFYPFFVYVFSAVNLTTPTHQQTTHTHTHPTKTKNTKYVKQKERKTCCKQAEHKNSFQPTANNNRNFHIHPRNTNTNTYVWLAVLG